MSKTITESHHQLIIRNLTVADYNDVKEIMQLVYANAGGAWTKAEFINLISTFSEGQICVEDNGKVVAAALALIIKYVRYGDNHTYHQIIGNGKFDTHDPMGETLYGIDVFVHPKYQKLRLGRRLYDARKELCEKLNLRAIIVGGRIPGYGNYHNKLTPKEYILEVRNKEIIDPVLSFQFANDFHLRKVMNRYNPDDRDSRSYAVLLEWINVYYEEKETLFGGPKSVIRIGLVQWKMRRVENIQELVKQIEFYVDTVARYNADFILFPEFFNAPLMAGLNELDASSAVRNLSNYTESLRDEMINMALSYNVNIITGSMPVYEDHKLYNVSYLCRRKGGWQAQYKLHITPDEEIYWGLQGGNKLSVIETDAGRIGILICYDVEFPELGRILAEQGLEVLFVPFWTDTKNAYLRVRRCAQARAIENECYVAITGSVGNLPNVENMDIQYSQAAVFSPSDFSFPHDAIVAESTPNTENTIIVDLDLDLLKKLHNQGSVRNLKQRRLDLYQLNWENLL